jgi:G3E family GTPase
MSANKDRNQKPAPRLVEISLAGQPLVLVTGILGAGKTTFLRALLPELSAQGVGVQVFINDYHNAAVDAATLAHLTPEVTAISGGCICCDSGEELLDALAEQSGRAGEVLVVETNGNTDTLALLNKLTSDNRTRKLSMLQVSLVDCERWQHDHWQSALEASQVRSASHVAFSRTDMVTTLRREAVVAAVSALNSRAAETSPRRLANQLRLLTARRRWLIPRTLRDRRYSDQRNATEPHTGHGHGASAHAFTSVELLLPGRLTEPLLRGWLSALPPEVLRVKGITHLRGEPGVCCGFQRVGPCIDLARYPAGSALRLGSRAILIGPNLDAGRLCRQAERAFTLAKPMPADRSARRV